MGSCLFSHIFFFPLLVILIAKFGAGGGQDQCNVSRCNENGPAIHFPFWLENKQQEHCGYGTGFKLSCNQKKTVLHLPLSVEVIVKSIDYRSQWTEIYDPNRCLPAHFRNLNLSASPFRFFQEEVLEFSFFNCSKTLADRFLYFLVPCLSTRSYKVYAIYDYVYPSDDDLLSCVKIYNVSSLPADNVFNSDNQNSLRLSWLQPDCKTCEAQNRMCSLLGSNSTASELVEVQCGVNMPKTAKGETIKILVTGLVAGTFVFVLGTMAVHRVYSSYRTQEEDRVKIAQFLEDYKALKPTRFTFADIKKITNNFKEKLGEGAYGTVFRGKLSTDILVAVKLLSSSIEIGEEFINEVGTMSRIHHVNVVRLVGFCADGIKQALVYEFLQNGSLEKFIFLENERHNSLDWITLENIALDIAKGIEYLHQGCDHQILHFDIKPHNILLDQNFNPKISDFGLAKLCSKDQSRVAMSAARGTLGYIAPELFSRNFVNVSYKSDVYSYGMLLLEMVGGRKNNDVTDPNTSQTYFPEWAYNRLSRGEDLGIMRNIEEDEHLEIAKKLSIIGLWCIQWHPIDRPCMKSVVHMLEVKGDALTMPPNPFASALQTNCFARTARALFTELEVISEAE